MSASFLVLKNLLIVVIAKLAPVLLHDIKDALVAAWPDIQARLLNQTSVTSQLVEKSAPPLESPSK